MDQSCVSSCDRKLTRNINPNPTMYSQERQQDHTQSSSTRKLVRRDETSSSARARKLERGEDIQIGRSNMEFHNMQASDFRYLDKVFKNLQTKLNFAEEAPIICTEALMTNEKIWGLFMSTTMKAAIRLGPNYVEILEVYRNTNFKKLQNLFDITQKLKMDHQAEILNVTTNRLDWTALSWTRICAFSPSVDYVDESKSTCLLGLRLVFEEMSDHLEADRRWENQVKEFRQSNSNRE